MIKLLKEKQNIPTGWQEKKLGDVLDYERPDNYIVKSTIYNSNNKIPVLTANKSFVLGYTDENFGIYENIPAIIFDDFTTDSKFVNFPFKVKSSAIKILKEKSKDTDLRFVFEKMKSVNFPTGSHKRFYISQYQNLQITLPPIKEQQKIAEILRATDEDIAKTQEVIEATEKLKQGLMQQLFTRGIGHTKFKETELGKIPVEWEVVKLGDIGTNYIGLTYSPKNVTDGTGTLVLRSSNVQDGHISYEDNVYVNSDIPEHLKTKKGDILLCTRNGSRNLIGKCAFIDTNSVGHSFGAFMSVYRTKYSDFIFQVFISDIFKNQINKFLGATINQITNSSLNSFIVPLPPTEEQKEIVKILSTVDEKISVNKKLKEKLTKLKKGLMFDLLSGKVRVKI